jgi:carbonic anhydrase/acetyltransferase-like protein (isoleucine patch superfamily)
MNLLPFEGAEPVLAPDAIVLPTATLVGRVSVGARASIWYGCVLRADEEQIWIGADTNIQDGTVIHADPGFPALVGDRVTVGHGAILHGATVDSDCLIGMRAVVLNGVHIGRNSLVAAGTVLREGTDVPPRSLVAGIPGAVKRELREDEIEAIASGWKGYVERARRHQKSQPGLRSD